MPAAHDSSSIWNPIFSPHDTRPVSEQVQRDCRGDDESTIDGNPNSRQSRQQPLDQDNRWQSPREGFSRQGQNHGEPKWAIDPSNPLPRFPWLEGEGAIEEASSDEQLPVVYTSAAGHYRHHFNRRPKFWQNVTSLAPNVLCIALLMTMLSLLAGWGPLISQLSVNLLK